MTLRAIHPGEHLAEELKEMKMSAAELGAFLSLLSNPRFPPTIRSLRTYLDWLVRHRASGNG